ncbi:MAG: thiamine phosphate synthase [Peptostreptococcaceae bacterium]|nr:thiamine phosphate synthase [Peptostreptococcaceae bacterium]
MKDFDISLYLVTDSSYHTEESLLRTVEEACRGGATLVQLREKEKSGAEYLALARRVKELTDRFSIPLIIDDRVDVAMAAEAAGVHLGAADIPIREARRLMGEGKIIGATAKTVKAAKKAYEDGADYLGTGAIFPTTTKVATVITEISVLNEICRAVPIPVAAIGGLNEENIEALRESPIDGVAVVSAIMKAEEPREATRRLLEKLQRMRRK